LSIVSQLKNKAVKFPEAKHKCFGLFSKSGFTKELEELSRKREDIILKGILLM